MVPAVASASPFPAAQQPATTCTSSNTLRWTLVTPPNALNDLISIGSTAAPWIQYGEYWSPLGDGIWPNGTYMSSTSITDWVQSNSNYTVWTYHIKPGLKWSDGSNVTSADLLASYGPKYQFNATYDIIGLGKEVKQEYAVNSDTAVFVLNQPDSLFSYKSSTDGSGYFVWPASVINQYGAAYNNFGTDLSVGPFYVSNYQSGQTQMTLLRNPYYSPQPKVCQADVNFVESLSLTATGLLSGSTDMAVIEPSNAQAILQKPWLKILPETTGITYLQYNDTVYPYNMTQFRQSLVFGINQSQIIQQAFSGYAATAYDSEGNIWSGSHSIYYNPKQMMYNFSQSTSLNLLKSIDITKGSNGVLDYPNGSSIALTLYTDSQNTADVAAAQVVKQNLQKLGFTINLIIENGNTITGDYTSNVNNIARTGMIMETSNVALWGALLYAIQPGWVTLGQPIPNISWEWPPNANTEFEGNLTAAIATGNQTLWERYAQNVQALNAEYLPYIYLDCPQTLWAFNTQRWTGWPSDGQYMDLNNAINPVAWDNLSPVGASNSTTSTSTSVAQSSSTVSSLTSAAVSSTASTSSSTTNYTLIAAAVVVVVIVIAAVVSLSLRRRRPSPR